MTKSSKPKQSKFTAPPPAPVPVIDRARVLLLAAECLEGGRPVALELGGMFEAVMAELNKLGYVLGHPSSRQLEAWIFPLVRAEPCGTVINE